MTEPGTKIVPFGKYKGQPVEAMVQDTSYVEWLTAQPWFREKFQPIYNVVVNNFGEPSETPEHNALQALFLSDAYALAFALATGRELTSAVNEVNRQHNRLGNSIVESSKYWLSQAANVSKPPSWMSETEPRYQSECSKRAKTHQEYLGNSRIYDAILAGLNEWASAPRYWYEAAREFEDEGTDVGLDVWVRADYPHELMQVNIPGDTTVYGPRRVVDRPESGAHYRIEVKPLIGDDYPAVLRQMKRHKSGYLFVEQANTRGVTVEQMCGVFAASGLHVVFKSEVDALVPKATDMIGAEG
jgi:hypothetical protein